MQVDKNRQNRT